MTDADRAAAVLYVDQCIEAYASRCRNRIPTFVDQHFSLEQTWALQRPTLWPDLLLAPVNSAWAIPYLAIKKTCAGLEALGVTYAARIPFYVPSGIKTGYQRKIEALIGRTLLEWDVAADRLGVPQGLVDDLRKHPLLKDVSLLHEPDAAHSLPAIIESFSAGRALVSDAAATLLTIAIAWFVSGNASLGLQQIADRVARRNAHDRAALRFFLGRRAGSVFYSIFRPPASRSETIMILIVLGAGVTVGALACTIVSDPLRKMVGLQQRRLSTLLDDIERELLVFSQKRIKRALAASPSA